MLATRRNLMAAVAVLPIAACPAPAAAAPSNVSAELSALLHAASWTQAEHSHFYRAVYEPLEQLEVRARVNGSDLCPIPAEVEHRDDKLRQAVYAAEKQVMHHPVATAVDLHAKVAFMVERALFDGFDPSATLLADAARLAGMEA